MFCVVPVAPVPYTYLLLLRSDLNLALATHRSYTYNTENTLGSIVSLLERQIPKTIQINHAIKVLCLCLFIIYLYFYSSLLNECI